MKLAICDESPKFLNAFRAELYKLDQSISLVGYTSLEKLTHDFSIIPFDAVIINTEVNSESGIDAAENLVRQKPATEILFVTDKPDKYVQMIFAHANVMKPFALFVKPISRLFMQHMINMLSGVIDERSRSSLMIKSSSHEMVNIRFSDIMYIEHNNRISYIHTDDRIISCRKPIQFFEEALPEKKFIHASKSMIVNAGKVESVQQNAIVLVNGESIYASRSYKKDFAVSVEKYILTRQENSTEPFYI